MPKIVKNLLAVLILFTLGRVAFCAEKMPTAEELLMVELRGRQIADYEQAAIKATDLLFAGKPDLSNLENYITVNEGGILKVYFGKVSDDDNSFKAAYIYSCPVALFDQMKPEADLAEITEEVSGLARAVRLAVRSIAEEKKFPRYNTDVFREEDSTITVYLLPGNEKLGVALLGGDFKVSVSKDGTKIINKTALHQEVIEVPLKVKDKTTSFHTHTSDDLPTETDVAFVLLHPVAAPHYVKGPKWMSRIDADGKVYILGKTKEMLKGKNK